MHQPSSLDTYMSASSMVPHHEVSPIIPWALPSSVHHHGFNQVHQIDPFLLPPPPPPSSSYGGFFQSKTTQGWQFDYEGASSDHHSGGSFQTILGQVVHQSEVFQLTLPSPISVKMSAQEIMDAKALAASKSHSEAERRRRERINNHLNKLRSILPNTTKTDKASLLAEVIQHVKELRRQTSIIAETCAIPTEIDELTVDNETSDEDGKFVIKASLCCEDRPDLLPDLIKTLKALKLRTLKAEITTLGGRVKNVLFITSEDDFDNNNGDEDQEQHLQYCMDSHSRSL
ncbi:hypothetical protein Leryth_019559 [Lithospermum erythrorhizon]|nr:hypothetical protein Leryth_019559 [Lithospermum erythrorhizon]